MKRALAPIVVLTVAASPAPACILCSPNAQSLPTLRQNLAQARLVLYGTLANARLAGNDPAGGGMTDFHIDKILKSDPVLGGRRSIVVPRYLPADPAIPPRFLLFCDVYKNKNGQPALDPYQGIPVRSEALVRYLAGILKLKPADRPAALLYFFKFLDDADETIANDAFNEFARATDKEIGALAGRLPAAKLRHWLESPQTPAVRLGLYAFLLGGCGGDREAALLRAALERPTERTTPVLDGFLCGYIQLRPKEGWELAAAILADDARPFLARYAVLRALSFYHGWRPQETQNPILRCLAVTIPRGELADLAIENLRRWQWWELTAEVIDQYPKKTHTAPLVRRSIIRYCLSCPRPEAVQFTADLRRRAPALVKDVEESLQLDNR